MPLVQVILNTPNNDMFVVDNSTPSATLTLAGPNNPSPIGFDTVAPATAYGGSQSQDTDVKGDTGSVLLDITGNDTFYADPTCATFAGNPVSMTLPTYKTVTKVLQDSRQGIDIAWKNPA